LVCFVGDADVVKSFARRLADGTTEGDENSTVLVRVPDGVLERLKAFWTLLIPSFKTLKLHSQRKFKKFLTRHTEAGNENI